MRLLNMQFEMFLAHLLQFAIFASLISWTEGIDSEVKFVAFRNESDGRVMCGEVDNTVLTWSATVRSQLECSCRCGTDENCNSFNFKKNTQLQPQPDSRFQLKHR